MDIIGVTSAGRHTLFSDHVIDTLDPDHYTVYDPTMVSGTAYQKIRDEDGINSRIIVPNRSKPAEPSIHFSKTGIFIPHYVGMAYIVRDVDGKSVGFNRAQRRMFTSSALRLRADSTHDHSFFPFVHDVEVNFTGSVVPANLLQCQCGKSQMFDIESEPGIDSIVMLHGQFGTPAHREASGHWMVRGVQHSWQDLVAKSPITPIRITEA